MKSRLLFRLAIKEILYLKKFTFFFILNITFGLLGLFLVESFKDGVKDVVAKRSSTLLGADLSMVSRFPIKDEKVDIINNYLNSNLIESSESKSLFTMLQVKQTSRLAYIKTLDGKFPFYGKIELKNKLFYPEDIKHLSENEIWVYPEILSQLKVNINDTINVGGREFTITNVVLDDPQQGLQMGALAPRIFMSEKALLNSGLIRKGATVRYYHFFKLNKSLDQQQLQKLNSIINENSIKLKTPEKSAQSVTRALNYLNDFLGLVSLVALFLCSIGIFYLYRSHINSRKKQMALLKIVGFKKNEIFLLYFFHLFIISCLGISLSLAISQALIPFANSILIQYFKFELSPIIDISTLGINFIIGMMGVLLLGLPIIKNIVKLPANIIFQELDEKMNKMSFTSFIPFIVYFSGLAFYIANSYKIGGLFILLFYISGLLLIPISLGILNLAEKIGKKQNLILKLAMLDIYRFKWGSITLFITFSLTAMLLGIIPQVEKNLNHELKLDRPIDRPSLFLFDIQDDQVDDIKKYIKSLKLNITGLSPMVRGRFLKINDSNIDVKVSNQTTREDEAEQRFRNRGVNISYRNEFSKPDFVIEGESFSDNWNGEGLPLSSIEYSYANRMDIKLGDILEFDILGVPIQTKVMNFRKVKWTSFLPNFFIQIQSGVLNDAPKTWLLTLPYMKKDKKNHVINQVVDEFPNISSIDISRVITKIANIISTMSMVMKVMAGLSLFVGVLVLFATVSNQIQERKSEYSLFQLLGLTKSSLKKTIYIQVFFLSATSCLVGLLFSIICGLIISNTIFMTQFIWGWLPIIIVIIGIPIISMISAFFVCRYALMFDSQDLLEA